MHSRRTLTSLLAILVPVGLLALGACESSYDFQPITLGQGKTPNPRPRSDGQFIRAVYADLLGRAPEVYDFVVSGPDGAELSRFPVDEGRLLGLFFDGVGDPAPLRALLAAGLASSAEVHLPSKTGAGKPEAFIAEQFRRLLGREPDPYELHAFVEEWQKDPAVGPGTVVRALCGSREYQSF